MKQLFSYLLLILSGIGLYAQAPMGKMPAISPDDLDALLKSMTEEDFNQILQELSKLTPQELEELEKEGRRILLESGIDPDTGKALAPEQMSQSPELLTPATTQITTPVVTRELIASPTDIAQMLTAIQTHLSDLRQKALYHDALSRRLIQWAEALQDLVFYVKVINKSEHHERLATKEFQPLLKNLNTLYNALKAQEPRIIVEQESTGQDDPYELLHVRSDATQQEIDTQYARLQQQYDTKKLKRRMVKEGATQKDIAREVRAAQLTFSLIKDAYEQIRDPQARSSFDKKRATQYTDVTASVQTHINALLETLSTLVYQYGLLESLQDFLKKYEPEQLAHKHALESASEQRKKELEETGKRKAITTHGQFDKRHKGLPPLPVDNYANNSGGYYPADYGYSSYSAPYGQPYSSGFSPDKKKESGSGETGGGSLAKSGKKAPKSEEDKMDEYRKALEKQETEKLKKEAKQAAEYKKELDALKKQPIAPVPPLAADTTQKAPAQKSPVSSVQAGTLLIENFEDLCQDIASALKSENVRSIRGLTRSGKKIAPEQCQQLIDELKLNQCLNQLQRIDTLCGNATEEQLAQMKPAWQTIVDMYSPLFKNIIEVTRKESNKYTLEETDVMPEYVCKASTLIGRIVMRINVISGLFSMGFKLLVEEPEPKQPTEASEAPDLASADPSDHTDTAAA